MSETLLEGQYFGRVDRRAEYRGLTLTGLSHSADRSLPCHRHEAPYFCLLVAGGYRESVGRRELDYRPFTLGAHPAHVEHSDAIGRGGARFFTIELGERWRAEARALDASCEAFGVSLFEGPLSACAARVYAAFLCDRLTPLMADSLAWELVGEAARVTTIRERQRPQWLSRALEAAHDRAAESLTIRQLAVDLSIHPVHFSREFRRLTGRAFGEYVHRIRVCRTLEPLASHAAPLADIALTHGFADQSHFCRIFKMVVGVTPGNFRATARAAGVSPST